MYSKILLRYGELTLKGKNRNTFINLLAKNITKIVNEKPFVEYDRMYLSYSEDNMKKLTNVFGLTSFSPVIVCDNNLESIKNLALKSLKKETKTFKIATRRSNKNFKYNSQEMNNLIGSFILKNSSVKVDVHNPDQIINVEIRAKETYVFSDNIRLYGGLPVGVSGSTLHLMSGGIDSPVAAFELMKRGLNVSFLSFVTPPQTDETTISKLKRLIQKLSNFQTKTIWYLADYSNLMNYISLISNEAYKITIMRRSFYRIACKIAAKRKIPAISNGENIGQVASQTLESLEVISKEADRLIFRPVLTNDKIDTINLAKQIGTYEISIEKANETCELFAPKEPVTKPKLEEVLKLEQELDMLDELENELIQNKIQIIKF
ncbi:tRNA uracil 4-sulfurtransferase ThiI [Mycoplasmopsis lipofaciens]|uniref:tRNA uracil 4-sulfurtransferase ThiI n=1 Tax=Mycoplasmopsis lipofaciens TaxID=114884 RepID=UPI0004862701|nr:tRNA uracil 4-sulfurtransferase ThiI [Mycoplasmopsis lipofaciens]